MLAPKARPRSEMGGVWSTDGTGLYVQYDDEGRYRSSPSCRSPATFRILAKQTRRPVDRPAPLWRRAVHGSRRMGAFAFTLRRGLITPADSRDGKKPAHRSCAWTNLNDDIWAKRKAATVERNLVHVELRSASHSGLDHQGPPISIRARSNSAGARNSRRAVRQFTGPRLLDGRSTVRRRRVRLCSPRIRAAVTSYGEEFGNLHTSRLPESRLRRPHGRAVDAVIALGVVSPDSLFVTGGKLGGRRADRVDRRTHAAFFARPGWAAKTNGQLGERRAHRGPASVCRAPTGSARCRGRIRSCIDGGSPTNLCCQCHDGRRWMVTGRRGLSHARPSEAEQFLRCTQASQGFRRRWCAFLTHRNSIDAKGSNLIAKTVYTIGWFDKYRGERTRAVRESSVRPEALRATP